jgi:hypothetical protein
LAIQARTLSGHGWSAQSWFVLAAGIASSVALWWRRPYPVAVLSIGAYAAYVANSWTDNRDPWVLLFAGPCSGRGWRLVHI